MAVHDIACAVTDTRLLLGLLDMGSSVGQKSGLTKIHDRLLSRNAECVSSKHERRMDAELP